jgi:hypothetical protein
MKTLFVLLTLVLCGCDTKYCYKGHDEKYTVNANVYGTFICDDWRDSHFKYDDQKGT